MEKTKQKKSIGIFPIIGFIVFGICTILIFVPMFWGFMSSFKTSDDFDDNLFSLPAKWVISNYTTAFRYFRVLSKETNNQPVYFMEMLFNTLLYAGVGTLVNVLCHYIVAYCTAKYAYKFSKLVYSTVLIIMVIPIVGDTASRLQFIQSLNMYNNWIGFFFQRFAFTGMYYLIMHETIKTVSLSLSEAAEIDGAGHFRIMWSIVFPQVLNIIGVTALLTFIDQWNEFQFAKMYMPSYPTLAYGLHFYNISAPNDVAGSVPTQLAGCMILFYPMLIIFIFLHDKMMGNLSMGGVKE